MYAFGIQSQPTQTVLINFYLKQIGAGIKSSLFSFYHYRSMYFNFGLWILSYQSFLLKS